MGGGIRELTEKDFAESVKSGVTLVDFWAPWCPPCRAQAPIVEKLAESVGGRAAVAKVNVDENGSLAARYAVTNIPTILNFKDGMEARRFVGLQKGEELSSALLALA